MKIVVFGATGRTGQQLVTQALMKGHDVTAFARQPNNITHEKLTWFKGNVLDAESVEHAVTNQDAVLCALGTSAMTREKLRSKGTKNIISAMEKKSVKRFICQSALGCNDSFELLPFSYKYLIIPLMLRNVYADHALQERDIESSNVNWTIVRPSVLIDKNIDGELWHGTTEHAKRDGTPKLNLKVTRKNVAEFMLSQLETDVYMNQAVNISY